MSLEQILADLGLGPRKQHGLEAQIQSLRNEIRRVGHTVSRHAGRATEDWAHDASDFGREAARQGAYLAGLASHQALRGADALRRDPVPAIAVIGTALLVMRLFRR